MSDDFGIGLLMGVVVGTVFTSMIWFGLTDTVPKHQAIDTGHAIYAPDTGHFTWLEEGDEQMEEE